MNQAWISAWPPPPPRIVIPVVVQSGFRIGEFRDEPEWQFVGGGAGGEEFAAEGVGFENGAQLGGGGIGDGLAIAGDVAETVEAIVREREAPARGGRVGVGAWSTFHGLQPVLGIPGVCPAAVGEPAAVLVP